MGTNYYMMTKNKELVERHFRMEYELTDEPFFGYEVHIGKRSCGWMPLFEEHLDAYRSVEDMFSFFKEHAEDIQFFDEYGKELALDELREELVDWLKKYTDDPPRSHLVGEVWDSKYMKTICWKDKDGYEFMKGDFC